MTLLHQNQQQQGKPTLFSVGRVQTPVLGLVVRRDESIQQFVSHDYFSLSAQFNPQSPLSPIAAQQDGGFKGQWQTPDTIAAEHIDEQGRIINPRFLDIILQKFPPVQSTPVLSVVQDIKQKYKQSDPPLPYSLSALQIEAAQQFHYSAQQTLNICQSLYEKYQLISYPRSDCRFLPTEHYHQRHALLKQLQMNDQVLTQFIKMADTEIRSKAWNDNKVDAHHAIIPTLQAHDVNRLGKPLINIFRLIARQYLAQFFPDKIELETQVTLEASQEYFVSKGIVTQQTGWSVLYKLGTKVDSDDASHLSINREKQRVPSLRKGQKIYLTRAEIQQHKTMPPPYFNDATLLAAMANIARFVKDNDLRKTLRETDGLGTEATRAGIIETLFKRQYLVRENKSIRATEKGIKLIHSVPESLSQPDMTAVWEAILDTIRTGTHSHQQFIQQISLQIEKLVENLSLNQPITLSESKLENSHKKNNMPQNINSAPSCPQCQASMLLRKGKYGTFWACPHYPSCRATLPIENDFSKQNINETHQSKNKASIPEPPIPCPKCHAPLVRRKSNKGFFWGCSQYPSCKQTLPDDKGKPVIHKVSINP
jgi:DNA topoisomerase-3